MFYDIPDDSKNYVVCRNTTKLVKLKVYVLHFYMYKSHNIMSLIRDMKLMSRDKSVELTGVLSCRPKLFECLLHNFLSLRHVLACDVTSLIYCFLEYNTDVLAIEMTGKKP